MPFWKRKAIDPVCGMEVVKKSAAATHDYGGKTYYFCAPGCKADFAKDPQAQLDASAGNMEDMGHC